MNLSPGSGCAACRRLGSFAQDPHFIHEFEGSVLFLGDHQYYPGYSVLMLKRHVREIHELDEAQGARLCAELRAATLAVQKAFLPWKMNHACLGNQVQHVHWHILPRYEDDPDRLQHPWLHSDRFGSHRPGGHTLKEVVRRIQAKL